MKTPVFPSILPHPKRRQAVLASSAAALLALCLVPRPSLAQTWLASPGSGDWNTASNWSPATVPNSSGVTATFDASSTTSVSLSASTEVGDITFTENAGASPYTITVGGPLQLLVSGAGITNFSAATQNFVAGAGSDGVSPTISFTNSASVDEGTQFTALGSSVQGTGGGFISFSGNSTILNSTLNIHGGSNGGGGGLIAFQGSVEGAGANVNNDAGGTFDISGISNSYANIGSIAGAGRFLLGSHGLILRADGLDTTVSGVIAGAGGFLEKAGTGTLTLAGANTYTGATTILDGTLQLGTAGAAGSLNAASAITVGPTAKLEVVNTGGSLGNTILNQGSSSQGVGGGFILFSGNASAGHATITSNGGTATGAIGGFILFHDSSSAGSATLNINGGVNGGVGSDVSFQANADGGSAIVNNNAGGTFDIGALTTSGMNIGSISGAGSFILGSKTLTVGGNGPATLVSGVISDGFGGGTGGSLTLSSTRLTLSGQNTYTGATSLINGAQLTAAIAGALPAPMADGGQGAVRTALFMDQVGTGFSTLTLGAAQAVASLSGAASSTIKLNGQVLTVGQNAEGASSTFAGVIADGTAPGGLTTDGVSTLTLSGVNTYTGPTMVNGLSTLIVGNGSTGSINGTSGVTVAPQGTFVTNLRNGSTFSTNVTLSGSGFFHAVFGSAPAGTNTLSGIISGAGTLLQSSKGTTVLTSASTYSGDTLIPAGVLQIGTPGAAGSIAGTDGVFLGAGGTLSLVNVAGGIFDRYVDDLLGGRGTATVSINSARTITLSGALESTETNRPVTLSVIKNGPGTAILESGTYNGPTLVRGGILEVGELGNTAVTVFSAALSGISTIGGDVLISSGGVLAPNAPVSRFEGKLTLAPRATTDIRLGDGNQVAVTGDLTLAGVLNLTPLEDFTPGTMTLITYSGRLFGGKFSAITGLPGYTTKITVVPNQNGGGVVNLSVSLPGALPSLLWDGAAAPGNGAGGSGVWDNTKANWSNPAGGADAAWPGGAAVFAGAAGTVTLGAAVTAQNLVFPVSGYTLNGSSTHNLTLSGRSPIITVFNPPSTATINAPIASSSGFIANGSGTLILTAINNFLAGNLGIITGTVQVGTASTAGSLGRSVVTLSDGGTLKVVNPMGNTLPNRISAGLGENGTVNVASAGAITLSGALSDNAPGQLALTLSGSGTTILAGAFNTNTGLTTIGAGTLQIGTAQAPGSLGAASPVSFQAGGALSLINLFSGAFSNPITNTSTASPAVMVNSTASLTLAGSLGDSNGGALRFIQNGAGATTLTGASFYSGATTVNAGTLQIGDGATLGTSIAASSGVDVNGSSSFVTNLADGSVFPNSVVLHATTTSFNAIQSGTNTLSGVISGLGAFNQKGTGTTILTGAGSYQGATTVSAGLLQIGNGASGNLSGNGAVTVSGQGSLALNLAPGATFTPNIQLSSPANHLQAVQVGEIFLSGSIGGPGVIDQTGPGITHLHSAGTFSGSTNVSAGVLVVDAGGSLGPGAVNVTGGTLQVDGTLPAGASASLIIAAGGALTGSGTIGGAVSLAGGTINLSGPNATISGALGIAGGAWSGTGTVTGVATSNSGVFTLSGTMTARKLSVTGGALAGAGALIGDLTYSSSMDSTFGGVIADGTGPASLTVKPSSGMLTLTGANTYTGPTTVHTVLEIGDGHTGSLNPASAVTLERGAMLILNLPDQATFANAVSFSKNGLLAVNAASGFLDLTKVISGGGGFSQTGAGTTTLDAAELYTDATTVSAGTLNVRGSLAALSTVNVSPAGTLGGAGTISGNVTSSGILNFDGLIGGTLGLGGGVWNGSGTVSKGVTASSGEFTLNGTLHAPAGLTVSSGALAGAGTLNGSLSYRSTGASTFAGVIADGASGKSSLTVSQPGTLTLTGANTYTGATNVSAGMLQIGDTHTGSISPDSAVTIGNGAALFLALPDGANFSNPVTMSGSGAFLTTLSTGTLHLKGVIAGTGTFYKLGDGLTELNATEKFTGAYQVSRGALSVAGSLALGSTVQVFDRGTLQGSGTIFGSVTSSGVLNFNGIIGGTLGVSGGSWNGNGTVKGAVTASSGLFTLNGNLSAPMGVTVTGGALAGAGTITGPLSYASTATSTFDGDIEDMSLASIVVTRAGGTLVLTKTIGAGGGTLVDAGTLIVNGSLTNSTVQVNRAGVVGGSGTFGDISIAGGTLAPSSGATTPATLTVQNIGFQGGAVNLQLGASGASVRDSDFISAQSITLASDVPVNVTPLLGFGAGTYELLSANAFHPNGQSFTVGAIPAPFAATIQTVNNQVFLVVTGGPAVQYWNGPAVTAFSQVINGGSGTWDNTTTNWTNAAASANSNWQKSVAVFSAGSGVVSVTDNVTAPSLGFVPGCGAYLIFASPGHTLTINGAGISNRSGLTQNLGTLADGSGAAGTLVFQGSATAADVAIFNGPATLPSAPSGSTFFEGTSTAAKATIANQGGAFKNALGGVTTFLDSASAGSATITNDAGIDGGKSGALFFIGTPDGSMAQVINNGNFDMTGVTSPSGLRVGSIAGSGTFHLGGNTLTVGGNGLNTTVTGTLVDGGKFGGTGGSLVKTGAGALTLTGANTYSGSTTVSMGTLQIGVGNTGAAALASTSVVTVSQGATLAVDLPSGQAFGNSVTDNGHFVALSDGTAGYYGVGVISGAGDLTLNAPKTTVELLSLNSYAGRTTVMAGTLVVDLAAGSGPVSVSAGGTLGGGGKIAGGITLFPGGDLCPGAGPTGNQHGPGTTLHAGSLLWNSGSDLTLRLGALASSDELILAGALTKGTPGPTPWSIDITVDPFQFQAGDFTLATFASTTFSSSDFTLQLPAGYAGSLSETSTALVLSISAVASGVSAQTTAADFSFTAEAVTASSPALVAAPEPGPAVLLVFGGVSLLGRRRRSKLRQG